MAVRQGSGQVGSDRAFRYSWSGLLNGDNGNPIRIPRFADKTWQAVGTFGTGGAVQIQGSMDNTNFFQLHDHGNTLVSLTSALPGVVTAEDPDYVMPKVTGGDVTTNLTIYLTAEGGT